MITFKPITIEDKAEIESFTLPYAPANCDLAFANMFCWQFQFKTAWSVVDGFLVIRFQIGGSDRIGYMQPVGAGDFTPVLRHLEEDILAAGQRLRIIDMTPEGLEKLRSVGHCQFAFASDRNLEDYVYNICNSLPQIIIAAGIIAAGIYLLTQQKKKLKQETETKEEHYWEPYRPYQQLTEKPVHTSDNSDKDTASEASSISDPENTDSNSSTK